MIHQENLIFSCLLTVIILLSLSGLSCNAPAEFYVSPGGNDTNPGTREHPFASLDHARQVVSKRVDSLSLSMYSCPAVHTICRTHWSSKPPTPAPRTPLITYAAMAGQTPVISGGQRLQLTWSTYKDGIMQATIPPARPPISSLSTASDRSWPAIPISIPMPRSSTVPPPTRSAPPVPHAGRTPMAVSCMPCIPLSGVTCTISSLAKTPRAT